ncbi:MAG: peptidylprolyl isomerase [Planctomycetes bacterium]|nr:peptidylprolyl isomerase [Planctomycetota bacterium]
MAFQRILSILLICSVPCAAAALAPQSRPVPRTHLFDHATTPLPKNVYCKINGLEIPRAEYGDWLQSFHGDAFIQDYVLARLVRETAKQYGVSVAAQEVEQQVLRKLEERISGGYRGRKDLFEEKELANFGKSIEEWKREQAWDEETDMLIARILKTKRLTTDADADAEFKRLYGKSGRELYIRAILFEPETPSLTSHRSQEELAAMFNKGVDDAQKKAAGVMKKLMTGATDFKNAALAYSDDYRSKIQGGDVGLYSPHPPLFGAEFDAIIQNTAAGKLVGPVRIQSGFIIAEITKEVQHDFGKERDAIRKELVEREPTTSEIMSYKGRLLQEANLVR